MKRIGEDVAEKLDYTPGSFSALRHVRGKWVCGVYKTLAQAPVLAHVIERYPTPEAKRGLVPGFYGEACRACDTPA
ncbi:hypothetical protein GCM10007933_21040 [Zoogloea oryzae]|uniref:Transposase IS66 zinc-finger binding domain-containing protein n=1 Tax=Zoogloea oryzae TaxID=310767 RepID=A0ABQ6FBL1_9RHOO|nr:IS66 family transposase zinc-finger binding domain-containing protein [Zoogloea oryzae]GLT22644.1 hypothetical protein GCM10007933_21040 [Zoogloea oryzae]